MKRTIIVLAAFGTIAFTACNSNDKSSKENDESKMNADTTKMAKADKTPMKEVTPIFNNVDSKLTISLKTFVDHYLHIKNSLVNNDGNDAAKGGREMADAMTKLDKSLFTAEQKKVHDGIEEDLKENAEHIGKSSDDIANQREHFSMMSKDIYELIKAFGGGQTLYQDHCPMANDNKGAMWLSEMKEVKNPYFGGRMNECVKVREMIK